jgi:exopolysaccharide biosynthesis polyprenyl glycosylphosphotransferase
VTSIRPTPPRMVPVATMVDPGGVGILRAARSSASGVPAGTGRHPRHTVSRAVLVTDLALVAAIGTLGVAVLPWFGTAHPLDGAAVVVALVALLGASLALGRCWHPGVVATGGLEYGRVVQAGTGALLVLALTEVALRDYRLQPITLVVLPVAVVGVLAGRGIGRVVRHRRRRRGIGLAGVLAVGSAESVADLVARTRRAPEHGWTVVAACTPAGRGACAGVPVVGDLDDVADRAGWAGVDVVAVGAAPGWTGRRLHQLAWALEGTDLDLVVDPGLMEVAGPRLHMTPVDGLPMIRLTQPTFRGAGWVWKSVVDRVVAALAVLVLSPVLLAVALAVVIEDRGPVFFRQQRVGRDGTTFAMVKFRSMVADAEGRLEDLVGADVDQGAGPLFKMRRDPRVTRVGTLLRRTSLDELPQLFNVVAGSMSLVGPRPPLPAEVAQYADDARRRLLVRPGMTGLWQVSGRSDLSWEETVRLDLRYVENWSPGLDIHILARTVAAVVTGRGAY